MARESYIPGGYWMICDRCGFKRRNWDMRKEWTGLMVCADTCWDPRHPQLDVKSRKEVIAVKDARPEPEPVYVGESDGDNGRDLL